MRFAEVDFLVIEATDMDKSEYSRWVRSLGYSENSKFFLVPENVKVTGVKFRDKE